VGPRHLSRFRERVRQVVLVAVHLGDSAVSRSASGVGETSRGHPQGHQSGNHGCRDEPEPI